MSAPKLSSSPVERLWQIDINEETGERGIDFANMLIPTTSPPIWSVLTTTAFDRRK
jgi:hypothetical protein